MARKLERIDANDVIEGYKIGESCKACADRLGVSRQVISRIYRENGIKPRTRSEAMYIRMANATPEERIRLTSSAHEAVRGAKRSLSVLVQSAKTRQRTMQYLGAGETELFDMLAARGHVGIKQLAVERYNIDIGIAPVAVELLIDSRNPMDRKADRKKIEYLTKNGWCVFYIRLYHVTELREAHADYIASFLYRVSRDPSLIGEYWVIGGDCKLEARGRLYPDDLS